MWRHFALVILFAGLSITARSQTVSLRIGFRDPACQNKPIKGVKVTLEGRRFSRSLKTDASGFFTISKLPPGIYQMTTNKYGFRNYVFNNIQILAGLGFQHVYDLERGYASNDYDRTINNPRSEPCKHEDKN